ncbi:TadE family protein [Neobacillus drentensis]|uniref:TadE/TadG family type IV pilus assembly protein n=1 Tax=Neobacillus drentensis TaxID=220684 RepID=UPI002FFE8ED2
MKSEKGQSLVETALMVPILLLFLFGILDFGRMLYTILTLDHAGREAARLASVHSSNADIEDRVNNYVAGVKTINITPAEDIRKTGDEVTIYLEYDFNFITPLADTIVSPMELTNTTVMRME